jgi:hypothetical protein
MNRRLLIAGLAALSALAVGTVAASGASATATAYTVGSPTAIPAGTSTGLALDSLSNWVLTTKQFGASIILTGTGGIDCQNCMGENQASPMDFTGTGGRLLFTGVSTNISGCTPEDPVGGPGTVTSEPLKITASNPGTANLRPVTGTTFAVFHLMADPGQTCPIAGNYTVEDKGAGLTASWSGDVLSVNSTTELAVNGQKASLKGEMTLTAGVTGGTYHPIEFKES